MSPPEASANWKQRGPGIALWILTLPPALLFMLVGGAKLAGEQRQIDNFAAWGYPSWFLLPIGVLELVGALLLLVPPLATVGAALLAVDMCGAIYTHLAHGEITSVPRPLVLLVVVAAVGWARSGRLPGRPGKRLARSRPAGAEP